VPSKWMVISCKSSSLCSLRSTSSDRLTSASVNGRIYSSGHRQRMRRKLPTLQTRRFLNETANAREFVRWSASEELIDSTPRLEMLSADQENSDRGLGLTL